MKRIFVENLKNINMIFLSDCPFFKFCKICDITESILARGLKLIISACAKTHRGGCQVCKCFWASEIGQRSTK